MKIALKDNERIDDLQINDLKIIQNKNGFCFGMDSVLLSDFAREIKSESKVIDLGTGTGILPILLSAKTKNTKFIGVEIQQDVAEMAQRSVYLNKLEEKIEIINENIKNLKNRYSNCSFDTVISNPPYKKEGTGRENIQLNKLISRHEISASLEDFIEISKYLLKDKGSLYMVHRPERLVDILYTLRKYKIEPKIIKMVSSYINEEPNLVLIKAVKNANSFLKIEKPLYIYEKNGKYSQQVLKIYQKEKLQ